MIYCDKACFRVASFSSTSPNYGEKQGEEKQAKNDQISKYCRIYARCFAIVFTFIFCYDDYATMFGKHPSGGIGAQKGFFLHALTIKAAMI
jgi:hypothetical protein